MDENKNSMGEKINRLLNSKRFYAIFSVLLAVVCWLVLSLSDDSDSTRVIYDVPVQLEYDAAAYRSFGLEIIGQEAVTVDVTVEGPRSLIYSLTTEDILVYPNVNAVTTSGIKSLRLLSDTANANARYAITQLSQESVELRFDTMSTEKFSVEVDMSHVALEEGYLLKDTQVNPVEITVKGPTTEVDSITRVVAMLPGISSDTPLSETCVTQGKIALMGKDAGGNEVELEVDNILSNMGQFSLSYDQAEVTLNVLRQAELPLKVTFLNVPQNFDTNTLGCTLDKDSVTVGVPTSYSEELDPLTVGYLEFDSFDYQKSYTFELNLPEDYMNISNVKEVTASCNTADYQTRVITVSDLRLVNMPEDMEATVVTKTIYNVNLVGPAEVMEQLDKLEADGVLEENVYGKIDAGKIEIGSGQQTVPVQIILPSHSSVFATGGYSAVVKVE